MQWSWFAIALLGSLFDVVGLLAAGAEVKPNHPSTSLCRAEAQVFFSYPITPSSQPISLCGSNSLDVRRGYFQYRFDKPGAVELQFRRDHANTQRVFRCAHYLRAQVDRSELTFDNQGCRYVVFDYYEGNIKTRRSIIRGSRPPSRYDLKRNRAWV